MKKIYIFSFQIICHSVFLTRYIYIYNRIFSLFSLYLFFFFPFFPEATRPFSNRISKIYSRGETKKNQMYSIVNKMRLIYCIFGSYFSQAFHEEFKELVTQYRDLFTNRCLTTAERQVINVPLFIQIYSYLFLHTS